MIVVLKFPVYIEIETDNKDRKLVTDGAREILYPELIRYLADARYQKNVLKQLSKVTGGPVDVKVLTEVDLIRSHVKDNPPSSTDVT